MAFTVENMNYHDSAEVMKWPEAKVGPQAEKELKEAIDAIQAYEDAKKTVESTAKVAEKEMKDTGITLDSSNRWGLELTDTPEPLSKQALMNNLEGDIFRVSAQNKEIEEELKYAFIPEGDARLKNLNRNPESAKQIQMETWVIVSG